MVREVQVFRRKLIFDNGALSSLMKGFTTFLLPSSTDDDRPAPKTLTAPDLSHQATHKQFGNLPTVFLKKIAVMPEKFDFVSFEFQYGTIE